MDNSCNMQWGGSVGRATDSRSKALRFKPRLLQEHKNKLVRVFPSQECRADLLSLPNQPLCVHACIRMITYTR